MAQEKHTKRHSGFLSRHFLEAIERRAVMELEECLILRARVGHGPGANAKIRPGAQNRSGLSA
jgi:hypothetical protein